MNKCEDCSEHRANYLTLRRGIQTKLCIKCVKNTYSSSIWDNPEFYKEKTGTEE